MKTRMQLVIGIIIGLAVGFGAGLYTAQVRNTNAQTKVVALKQPTESPELQAARTELNHLRARYTDENPIVKRQQERIRALETRK
jgi:uncharacterized protein HemX